MPDPLNLQNPQDWPPLLTASQVAELLLLNRQTVLAMIARGELPAVKAGKQWRIAPEDVWSFVPYGIRARWPEGPWRAPPAR